MINEKQRLARSTGIFSSDVPRIMAGDGVRVALEKMGELPRENLDDVPEIQLGNMIEARILDTYEAQHGGLVKRSPDTMRHPQHQWLGAHLDGFTLNEIVEAKSVGWYNRRDWGEPGTDEVPDRVLWQVQEQLAVARLPIAKVPVCFITEAALVAFATGRPLPIDVYVIPADADLEAYIVERCGKVWQHVEARTLPEPEAPRDARLLYRKDSGAIVEATTEMVSLHTKLVQSLAAEKAAKAQAEELKAQLQAFMKEASELRYGGRALATWKLTKDSAGYTVAPKPGYRKFLTKEPQ
jgi:hypothetical protein